jgi:hypothetical protein
MGAGACTARCRMHHLLQHWHHKVSLTTFTLSEHCTI